MAYNYRTALLKDIQAYFNVNRESLKDYDKDDLREYLNDELLANDSITGNGINGGYFQNSKNALPVVLQNLDLCIESLREFGVDEETVSEKLASQDYAYFDTTIRCYLLAEMVETFIDNLEDNGYFDKFQTAETPFYITLDNKGE